VAEPSNGEHPPFDSEVVRAKYQAERARRMVVDRTETVDLSHDERFANYLSDPFTVYVPRHPVVDDVDVVIIGAGLSGVIQGAELRKAGIERIRFIDKAGGVGGTWYWNRYPGLMCDVESYIYMPMLEEMATIPTMRYASGEEIRLHLEAIADRYHLVDDALFHTSVETTTWDDDNARWVITTDHGDEIRTKYVIMCVGILNLPKVPAIPGMEDFEGESFHTARWNYTYTGGSPTDPHLTNLADKTVAIVGTGGSGIQCVPPLACSAKHLYVFQRTPSAIAWRANVPTTTEFLKSRYPGWQRERTDNFSAVMIGKDVDIDMVHDAWTEYMARVANYRGAPGMSPDELALAAEAFDHSVMETHRARVDEMVHDPTVAEALKPYYRYLCKRPLFHDEYLSAFNLPTVTLVDCAAGIERITPRGIVADGHEYEVDCIIYATGFEAEVTPFPRRAAHDIIGRGGVSIADRWKDGPRTLHGIMTRGFPNLFLMPAPGQQAVITVNITHLYTEGAIHIAQTIAALEASGAQRVDVRECAEAAWTQRIVDDWKDNRMFMAACTPSRLNFEGHPEAANPKAGTYGGGYGDIFAYRDLLAAWRADGTFRGLEIDAPPRHARKGHN
jgi:cation diffusion facilitator CzcD-associated flavoprotein CzcO